MEKLELRMYGLVPYNISDIQKGIQFGHAVVEYGQMLKKKERMPSHWDYSDIAQFMNRYDDWADNYKTFIILNGGTSNHSHNRYGEDFTGTMEENLSMFHENEIPVATFYEPDLNDMLSGIVWIADERVFNSKDYPDFRDWLKVKHFQMFMYEIPSKRELYSLLDNGSDPKLNKLYDEWVEFVGGKKNAFLKEFQNNFSLA